MPSALKLGPLSGDGELLLQPRGDALRLVLVGAGARAVQPGAGREGGGSEAGRQRRATDPSPGGSGRYRPDVARVGGGRWARRRRERGDALAGWGEREAIGHVASSDSSVG